ncbi:type II secretion system F family protein [Hydrogenophaga sp. 5NK40-0174]|uniref:type II secretion system F family protein n=1 Tax=Hydrogenophaga sp. 5NK40-0174 TaxID=3127649 RepID=UPI00310AFAEE
MTQFKVRAIAANEHAVQTIVAQGSDANSVSSRLQDEGWTVLSCDADASMLAWLRSTVGRKRTGYAKQDFALFCREVRTLIVAGMTVVEAVDTLASRSQADGRVVGLPAELLSKLEDGISLANAIEQIGGAPSVLIAAVRAGERTSDLVRAMDDYLAFDAMVEGLQKKVVSASIYPLVVTTLGVAISLFLLMFVMPSFSQMYTSMMDRGHGSGNWLIAFSLWLAEYRAAGFVVVTLVLALLAWSIWSGALARKLLSGLRRLPAIEKRLWDFQLAMVYQTLALMLKGGYSMTEALSVASRSALDGDMGRRIESVCKAVEEGRSISEALGAKGLCDQVGRRIMAAAERNGDFHMAADLVSKLHGERFELFVERATRIVEPVLLLFVALMVGTIVVMMYMPILEMSSSLG